jgi:chemotaxis protein MotB
MNEKAEKAVTMDNPTLDIDIDDDPDAELIQNPESNAQ